MKTANIKLSKETTVNYILVKEDNQYSIICIEESLNDGTCEIYKAPCITSSKDLANKIFKALIRYKVYGVTFLDVIYDLLN